MKRGEQTFTTNLIAKLDQFRFNGNTPLNFTANQQKLVFSRQVRDSIRRIDFIKTIASRPIHPSRTDPSTGIFDPIRASMACLKQGNFDEACWLAFVATHFGKHSHTGWELARQVYGALGSSHRWDWAAVRSSNPSFRQWMIANEPVFIANADKWKFSNHRKYQSMKVTAPTGTVAVFESYVDWVQSYGSHRDLFLAINQKVGQNPQANFDRLYKEMDAVRGFGRLGKFDHLTMLSKIGIVPIEPPSPYIVGSTGPRDGAELLFGAQGASSKDLNKWVIELGAHLGFGMQVMEDSMCNWQKSPDQYILFMG